MAMRFVDIRCAMDFDSACHPGLHGDQIVNYQRYGGIASPHILVFECFCDVETTYIKSLAVEPISNRSDIFLGPLLNPASAKYQIIGVGDKSIIPLMGEALISSGSEKVWFVQSEEGMDEFSPVSQNLVVEYSQDNPQGKQFQVEAICEGEVEDLQGGDVATNLEIFEKVLNNQATEQQTTAVAINAAAGMIIIGLASDLKEGVAKAKELLKSGKVRQKFEEYKDLSNQV